MTLNRKALICIDLTYSFFPGGELGVKGGFDLVPIINGMIRNLVREGKLTLEQVNETDEWIIVFTRDLHDDATSDHIIQWGPHSMKGTRGSEYHDDFIKSASFHFLNKGMGKRGAYSAFDEGADIKGMNLDAFLKSQNVTDIYPCGLATDYCVKDTAIDGTKYGYKVHVVSDAMKAVEIQSGDGQKAIEEMVAAGALMCTSDDVK